MNTEAGKESFNSLPFGPPNRSLVLLFNTHNPLPTNFANLILENALRMHPGNIIAPTQTLRVDHDVRHRAPTGQCCEEVLQLLA